MQKIEGPCELVSDNMTNELVLRCQKCVVHVCEMDLVDVEDCFYFTQELLESINTLKVEEWYTNSLQIVEKEEVIPACTLASLLPLLHVSEDEGDSQEMTCNWIQRDTEDATGDVLPDVTAETFSQRTDLQTSPFAFSSEYTTMETFQQAMPQGGPAKTSVTQGTGSEPEDTDLTVVKSELEYVRQFSTSPILDSEEISTIL